MPAAHLEAGILGRDALPFRELVVGPPVVAVARVGFRIDEFEFASGPHAQTEPLEPLPDHLGPAHQDRPGEPLVDHDLHGAQHALVLALGVNDAPRRFLRRREQRLHDQAGVVDELQERIAVGVEIRDRARRHAGSHRRLRHRRRDARDQPRVERPRDDVLGAEADRLDAVGERHLLRGFRLRQPRDGFDRGQLHLGVDVRRAHVERAAEDEREAQDVVHLVRVVRASGRDDAVRPRRGGELGHDLRIGIGEGENQRPFGHLLHHRGLEHPARGQAEKHVGAGDHLVERTRLGLAGVARLVGVHLLAPALVDHALDVGDRDVGERQAHFQEQVQAGERRSPRPGGNQLHLFNVFLNNLQAIRDRRGHGNRRAVLVVVEHRDLHPLAQLALDGEALG